MHQPPVAPGQESQDHLAAMLQYQMQMAAPHFPPMMMPPFGVPPAMPMFSPVLTVRVDGLTFEYQLTEDDVRKVFSRYGGVTQVVVDREGTSAQVYFEQPHQAMAAQQDLDRKQLAGMQGAFLRVEFSQQHPPAYDPILMQQMAAAAATGAAAAPNPFMPGAISGYGAAPPAMPATLPSPLGRSKKHTCKLEVGIENEGEFRVGSRVIQIARQIWSDTTFQEHGGKTRLRGKGIGGPHEADEPLALCISCRDKVALDKATSYAESQLKKVHEDYRAFCQQKGKPVPELSVKISTRGTVGGMDDFGDDDKSDQPKGERPSHAPTDEEICRLIEERNEARKAANFKRADEVRDYLKQRGVVLMDEKGAKGNFKGEQVTKWRFWRP
eukprot:TRINITY_DN35962_c0_g1_i1.p1 TRINITY_DN35962_c0_g1~~TRINITY_DN35962_c0_g1_i1.p1  ORF type:complete len:383 (+),score=89.33 TRINITY_DN35962_c0_g1_i1:94-1242(+)